MTNYLRMARRTAPSWSPSHVLATGGAVFATAGLGWALLQPGFHWPRLALAPVIGTVAWVGVYANARGRTLATTGAGMALFLLGFWQAVLWMFILPPALLFLGLGIYHAQAGGSDTGSATKR